MRPADLKHPEVMAGMAALVALVKQAGVISSETCTRFNPEDDVDVEALVDGRDYEKIAECAAEALRQNFVEGSQERRKGFLLAMADMLSLLGDGCAVAEDWDPGATLDSALREQAAAVKQQSGGT